MSTRKPPWCKKLILKSGETVSIKPILVFDYFESVLDQAYQMLGIVATPLSSATLFLLQAMNNFFDKGVENFVIYTDYIH